MTSSVSRIRPSDARREALKNADAEMGSGKGVPLVSQFFHIDRYYNAADKVLESFEDAYSQRRLDDAYIYGKRFAAFSLEAIPTHNYYRSPAHAKRRKKNDADMRNVIQKLEQVAVWMDAEETERQRKYQEQLKLHQEQMRRHQAQIQKQREAERRKMMELQQKIQQRKKERLKAKGEGGDVAASALSKLQQLRTKFPSEKKMDSEQTNGESTHSLGLSDNEESSQVSDLTASMRSDSMSLLLDNEGDQDLPPPVPPPPIPPPQPGSSLSFHVPTADELFPPPPSYSKIMSDQPQPPPPPSYDQAVPGSQVSGFPLAAPAGRAIRQEEEELAKRRVEPEKRVPIRKLKQQYTQEYRLLKQQNKIAVMGLDTFQGRYRHSTNGCAVISPLVVSHHLTSCQSVSDEAIRYVIDTQCGPILKAIRSKLQLEGDALIIPSDVHDYMVDHKLLSQEKFVGATGGNMLDDAHLDEFLKTLSKGETKSHADRKAGAALFFREHVVSIVKVPTNSGSFCYDLIDSMPNLVDVSTNTRMATRTRCSSIKSLKAMLKWYACSHLSESNFAYIDQNAWDECMADFDPRVFQAFVWADV